MEFPITDLLDQGECEAWILKYFHAEGLKCPRCGEAVEHAHYFRTTGKSQLTVHRCNGCGQIYNLYSGTVFQHRHLTPRQVAVLLRGILKGEASHTLANELDLHYDPAA